LLAALLAEFFGWRAALGGVGVLAVLCAALLWRFLPASRHAPAVRRSAAQSGRLSWQLAGDPVLRLLFAEGFMLMGAFVTVYNYTAYRLVAPPYRLSQASIGLIFTVYLVGVASSIVMGHVAHAVGRRRIVLGNLALMLAGAVLTLSRPLWLVIGGIAVLTAGFFGAHSVVSAWVGAAAPHGRSQASALYLLAYYAGSSVLGAGAGLFWHRGGWDSIVALVAAALVAAVAVATCLPAACAASQHEAHLP
jgi:YNFM family putative membrane transporter